MRRTKDPLKMTVGEFFGSRHSNRPALKRRPNVTLADLEREIFCMDRIKVVFSRTHGEWDDGHYPYERSLAGNFSISTFHNRLAKFISVPYKILDGYGDQVTNRDLPITALRATYNDAPRNLPRG